MYPQLGKIMYEKYWNSQKIDDTGLVYRQEVDEHLSSNLL